MYLLLLSSRHKVHPPNKQHSRHRPAAPDRDARLHHGPLLGRPLRSPMEEGGGRRR